MTRSNLALTLRGVYSVLLTLVVIAFVSRFIIYFPGFPPQYAGDADRVYEFFKDMSPVLIAAIAAYLANTFQRRSKFVHSLEEEWRGIVRTKSALYAFCEKQAATVDDYIVAFCRISEALDNMRIVYKNVGETDELIGLYPYAPLHDMRRALQTLDPRKNPNLSPEHRKLVRDAILQSFYALRENFLEELDLNSPDHPLLISGGRRLKISGSTPEARSTQAEQGELHSAMTAGRRKDIDDLLAALYTREQNGMVAAAVSPPQALAADV